MAKERLNRGRQVALFLTAMPCNLGVQPALASGTGVAPASGSASASRVVPLGPVQAAPLRPPIPLTALPSAPTPSLGFLPRHTSFSTNAFTPESAPGFQKLHPSPPTSQLACPAGFSVSMRQAPDASKSQGKTFRAP